MAPTAISSTGRDVSSPAALYESESARCSAGSVGGTPRITVRRLMPISQRRSSVIAGLTRRRSLETADGQLLDQDRGAAAETAGEHEAQIIGDRDHLLQQGDHVPGNRQLLHWPGQLSVLD